MKVLFYGNVREYTNNEKSFEVNCASVRDLVSELGSYYGERFKEFLLSENTCLFLVNGKGLMMTGGLDTHLDSGDKIEILPFIGAG